MSSIVHLKATPVVDGLGSDLCSPFLSPDGKLHAILQASGRVVTISNIGSVETVLQTSLQPSSGCFSDDGSLYLCDHTHSAVFIANLSNGSQDLCVDVYEDRPLKGKHTAPWEFQLEIGRQNDCVSMYAVV